MLIKNLFWEKFILYSRAAVDGWAPRKVTLGVRTAHVLSNSPDAEPVLIPREKAGH